MKGSCFVGIAGYKMYGVFDAHSSADGKGKRVFGVGLGVKGFLGLFNMKILVLFLGYSHTLGESHLANSTQPHYHLHRGSSPPKKFRRRRI